jgi:two-component system LytT family response regulator
MLRVLIIDDEGAVRNVISDMIRLYIPDIVFVGEADGVATGLKAIREHLPDILLLDIKMADGTGFDLLDKLDNVNFKVIFITAYEEYAIQAFKYSAIDYILKPIDPDELAEAIRKAAGVLMQEMALRISTLKENLSPENTVKKILVKTSDNIYLLKAPDILCCESDQAYTRIYLTGQSPILVSRTLREFEEMLVPAGFYRVHKSFLINLNRIDHFEKADGGMVVMQNGFRVPVSSRKKEQFLNMLENLA